MQEDVSLTEFEVKRRVLEQAITQNSCLIDLLKEACENHIEDGEYFTIMHSVLCLISEKQMETLNLVSELH